MAKILVVEDDNFFREAICDLLAKKGHSVLQAPNGKVAKDIISMQELDMVLSDIQMPGLSGVELLEWSQANKPVPFIIMTGFSMLLETQDAFELGAKEFLAKPFKNADLFAAIDKVIGKQEFAVVTNDTETVYCKVSIEEFVARPKVEFEIFVKLSENKYIKLAHQGEILPKERLEHYKSKGVKHLYIMKDDFGKLVDFNLNVANILKDRTDISQEKKLNFLKYTGEVILEKLFIDGVDKKSFAETHSFMNMATSAISESDDQLNLISLLNSHSNYIYAHSMGVAMYSVMIAKEMGYESSPVLFKLSMAGIFHDIGKKEIDVEILDKPRPLLSGPERKIIESHVIRGQEILMAIKNIPEEVIQIVYEHHEDCASQGYPNAKNKNLIHPLSKIVQLANIFMEHALRGPNSPGMTGPTAVNHIEKVYGDRVDKKCMTALRAIFEPK